MFSSYSRLLLAWWWKSRVQEPQNLFWKAKPPGFIGKSK